MSVMMGTSANKDIFMNSWFYKDESKDASPNDLCTIIDSDDEMVVENSLEEVQPKQQKAQEKGLIVIGPDCGTGILQEDPVACANVIEKGNIGIVGASGTGIQEAAAIISRKGGGISYAIGTGGRDLSQGVGAVAAIRSLETLAHDPETDIIVFISEPPAPEVRDKVVNVFITLNKPVVAAFIGEKPREDHDNVHYACTLKETASIALDLSRNSDIHLKQWIRENEDIKKIKSNEGQREIKGYYCGGALALEAAMIIEDVFNIDPAVEYPEGIMLRHNGTEIINLGDDAYTQGRAHPMIDPSLWVDFVSEAVNYPETAVILLDHVIGCGGHEDMAGVFAPVIKEAKANRPLVFIVSVTGSERDPLKHSEQVKKFEEAGAIVAGNNAQATRLAIEIIKYLKSADSEEKAQSELIATLEPDAVISNKPRVINVGFAETRFQCQQLSVNQ